MSATYDEIADWYAAWLGPRSLEGDRVFGAVLQLIGDVAGLRVCDLACGEGRCARHLAELGADVVGVDISERLLAMARRYEAEQPLGISYVQADVGATPKHMRASTFDGVLCFMALMDVADLEPTLRGVHRLLRSGGWFVFAILHPCFNSSVSGELMIPEGLVRTVGRYFDERHWSSPTRTGPPGRVGAHHRMLSTYLNLLIDLGFSLDRFVEPQAEGPRAASRPVWTEVPSALVVRSTKR